MRRLASRLALLMLAAAASTPGARGGIMPGFNQSVVASGLDHPTAIGFLPDGRILVTEQSGALKLITDGSATTLIVASNGYCSGREMGLLGIAVDPGFETNGFVYLYRTNTPYVDCDLFEGRYNEVIRVTMGPDGTVDPQSLTVLLTGIRTDTGYNTGGALRIGPDGKLYVGAGDTGIGGTGETPGSNINPYPQDLGDLEGKILRINLDGTIPADNPFAGQAGKRGEIWAFGFRNPWRFNFDPLSGRLWVGEVGDAFMEELNIVVRGGDYSWPYCEGVFPLGCRKSSDIRPVFSYTHWGDVSFGDAVVGGDFAGDLFGVFTGSYFFGDFVADNIYAFRLDKKREVVGGPIMTFLTHAGAPVDIVFGPDGALYYAALTGEIRKVTPAVIPSRTLGGTRLALRERPAREITVVSRDPVTTERSMTDPMSLGGSVRIVADDGEGGSGIDHVYPLPAEGWQQINFPFSMEGFAYHDPHGRMGPIRLVRIQNGKVIKLEGRGEGLGPLVGGSSPGAVNVILTAGTERYCMSFGGKTQFRPRRSFAGSDAPAPAACHP